MNKEVIRSRLRIDSMIDNIVDQKIQNDYQMILARDICLQSIVEIYKKIRS